MRFLPLALAAWVVLEIWLLIEVAQLIGWFALLVLLLASAVLGGWVVKRAGLRAVRATAAGQAEARTAVSIAGGLLLILPGMLSDLLGLACLFPPTAALLRRIPAALLRRGGGPISEAYRMQEQLRIHRPDGKVVPGEVIVGEVVDEQPRRPSDS
ncbi:FxsA family protein [Streptacidiphilus sp. 4-A2]|nr:FxsA family protein [Streptacidiphilus sp. 4-A2]